MVVIMVCVIMLIRAVVMTSRFAPGRIVFPSFVEPAGAQHVFRAQCRRSCTPGHRAARKQQRLGEILAHQLEVVRNDHHRAIFAVPALDQSDQVTNGLGIDGVEGFIEQDQIGILHQNTGKQGALQLSAGKRVERAAFKSFEPNGHQRLAYGCTVLCRMSPEQAAAWPKTQRDQVDDARWKAAVELRLLRQVGNADAWHLDDSAGHRTQRADDTLHEGRLA